MSGPGAGVTAVVTDCLVNSDRGDAQLYDRGSLFNIFVLFKCRSLRNFSSTALEGLTWEV